MSTSPSKNKPFKFMYGSKKERKEAMIEKYKTLPPFQRKYEYSRAKKGSDPLSRYRASCRYCKEVFEDVELHQYNARYGLNHCQLRRHTPKKTPENVWKTDWVGDTPKTEDEDENCYRNRCKRIREAAKKKKCKRNIMTSFKKADVEVKDQDDPKDKKPDVEASNDNNN